MLVEITMIFNLFESRAQFVPSSFRINIYLDFSYTNFIYHVHCCVVGQILINEMMGGRGERVRGGLTDIQELCNHVFKVRMDLF